MIDFDANGIHVTPEGYRIYKRMVEFRLDGQQCVGGVYIGQSTEDELLIERFAFFSRIVNFADDGHTLETGNMWKPSGEMMTVRVTESVRIWEPERD